MTADREIIIHARPEQEPYGKMEILWVHCYECKYVM